MTFWKRNCWILQENFWHRNRRDKTGHVNNCIFPCHKTNDASPRLITNCLWILRHPDLTIFQKLATLLSVLTIWFQWLACFHCMLLVSTAFFRHCDANLPSVPAYYYLLLFFCMSTCIYMNELCNKQKNKWPATTPTFCWFHRVFSWLRAFFRDQMRSSCRPSCLCHRSRDCVPPYLSTLPAQQTPTMPTGLIRFPPIWNSITPLSFCVQSKGFIPMSNEKVEIHWASLYSQEPAKLKRKKKSEVIQRVSIITLESRLLIQKFWLSTSKSVQLGMCYSDSPKIITTAIMKTRKRHQLYFKHQKTHGFFR